MVGAGVVVVIPADALEATLQDADGYAYITVDQPTWALFVKLAVARDAYLGFQDLMGQLRGRS